MVNPDQKKTKTALLHELKLLRQRVTELELQLAAAGQPQYFTDEKALAALLNPDLIPLATWKYCLTSGKFECSPQATQIIALPAERNEYSLNNYLDTAYGQDRRNLLHNIEKIGADFPFFKQLVRYQHRDGQLIPTITAAHLLPENRQEYIVGFILDLRPFYQGRQASAEEKYRYHRLFDLSPSGIILEDSEGTILDVNPSFCQFLGYQPEELIGHKVHMLAHPEVKGQVDQHLTQLLAGETLKHNVKSIRKNGSICYMELSETRIILPNGQEGILCIAEDFTQRIQAQHENFQKEKLEGILEMAGAVCHEINQPLTTIFITTDMLLDFPRQENIKDILSVIKSEAIRIGKITEKLMKVTRYETRDYIQGKKIFDIDKSTES